MGIKGIFGLVLLYIIVLAVNTGYAAAGLEGQINLTIAAAPPAITSIRIMPEVAYPDSVLDCEIELWGNNLSDATIRYKWYVDGEFRGNEKQFSGFDKGEVVVCKAQVYDSLNRGETKSNTTIIKARNAGITGAVVSGVGNAAKSSRSYILALVSLIAVILAVKAVRR